MNTDLKFAFRQLLKNPGFTAVALLTLALGIGANTAIFSVIHAVLLQPLPYPEPDRLVWFCERTSDSDGPIAYPNFEDWRSQQDVFEHMGVYKWESAVMNSGAEPVQLDGSRVSMDLLASLGVRPVLGRIFRAEEDKPGAAPTALISHALWKSQLGGSPEVLDQSLTLDGQVYSVIGVMPERFEFPGEVDYWLPAGVMASEASWQNRNNYPGLYGIGRLKSGVTLEQAKVALEVIASRLEALYPESNKGRRVQIESLHEHEVGGVSRALWILLGAVGLVLLIACANVTNLFLARAAIRQKEMTLRSALGASRGRIVRQLLTESAVLGLTGGTAGVLLAAGLLRILSSTLAAGVPRAEEISLNGPVLLFSTVVAILTGFLFGVVPAWQSARVDLQQTLKEAGRGATGRSTLARHALVITEVAVSLVLLTGLGLFLKSFQRLQILDAGYNSEDVLTFQVNLPPQKYSSPDSIIRFYQALLEQIRILPGVQAASLSSRVPLENSTRTTTYIVEGEPIPEPQKRHYMNVMVAGPDYFRVAGTPILRGRAFADSDNRHWIQGHAGRLDWASGLNAVIIDEQFAKRHWPDVDPIGRRIRPASRDDAPWMTIVGIVPTVKWRRLDENAGLAQAYLPFLQTPLPRMRVLIKTDADRGAIIAAARQAVLRIDPQQPIQEVQSLGELRTKTTGSQRLNLTLLGLFGLIALALAAVGLYGVLAYTVSQRFREIGVRMALGARRRDIFHLIVGQGMTLVLTGTILGIATALGLTRFLRGLLFQVAPTDPITFMATALVLILVSAFACWIPARRAARFDPMAALRTD